jgi:hypothetical protein
MGERSCRGVTVESRRSVLLRRRERPQRGYVELRTGVGDRGEKRTGKKITRDPRVPGHEKRGKMMAEADGTATAGWRKGAGNCRAGPG